MGPGVRIPSPRLKYTLRHGPVVKRPKTSPFHGGNSGSNPDGVTISLLAAWAFSSVGQSCRLITGWSWVRVPEGPLFPGPVAQLVRAPACHVGGRGFEPLPGRFSGKCQKGYAGVAQLAEQLICNQQVAGSSPIASSILFGKERNNFIWMGSRVAKGNRL